MLLDNTLPKPKNEDQKIWRYLDLLKFIDLLETQELFFSRADKLGDDFEGTYTKKAWEQREKIFKIWEDNGGKDGEIQKFREMYERGTIYTIQNFFVNCWHMNDFESAAMWRLYLKSNEGIAIQSTFRRLKKCKLG